MLQVADRLGAEPHFVNKGVGGDILLTHGFPQWLIADHIHPAFLHDTHIIF